jgi:hypothetical protein
MPIRRIAAKKEANTRSPLVQRCQSLRKSFISAIFQVIVGPYAPCSGPW